MSIKLLKFFVIFLSVASLSVNTKSDGNPGCTSHLTGGNGGGQPLPQCDTLIHDSTFFSFSEVHLNYNLSRLGAFESDRMELNTAHSSFESMIGSVTWLGNILYYADNYPVERKPSISANFSFDNCTGKKNKVFSPSEVVGNTLFGIPYQPAKLKLLEVTIKTIRTLSSNCQLVWSGKANIVENTWGTLNLNGQLSTKVEINCLVNTTPGPGSFAGNILELNDAIAVYENTLEEGFEDNIVEVTISNEPFLFSSTLGKKVYYHGFYDSSVIWHRPTIFDYAEEEEEGEGLEGEGGN